MFLNSLWLGAVQKGGEGTKSSRPEELSASRSDFRTYLLSAAPNWAPFCIKQKSVQIPPYLWCISYINLFLYPLSKSHKKLEVLKHPEE